MIQPRKLRAVTDTERPQLVLEDLRPEWMDQAACKGYPQAWWFPQSGRDDDSHYALARAVCNRCPVRQQCLDWAVSNNDRHGMFGGLTPNERPIPTTRTGKPIRHGTASTYTNHRCRCGPCTDAHREAMTKWRTR